MAITMTALFFHGKRSAAQRRRSAAAQGSVTYPADSARLNGWEIGVATAAQELAERALDAAGIGGWDLDCVTGRLTWTRITFDIHELPHGEMPAVDLALSFYPPEARPLIEGAIEQAMQTGAPWDLDLPFVTARGRQIWVRSSGRAIRRNGRTLRLTGAFQDITGRHKVTEWAERAAVVVRQMTNAIIMTDAQGRTEWVNDAFCRLTGFTLEELRGRRPGHILQGADSDAATIQHMRESLARAEGFDVEIINYTRDAVPYWIAITCTPLRDPQGALSGFIAVEADITARRAAEDQARAETIVRQQAEALLRDVVDALPSAVTAYDASERLIFTNRAYRQMLPISATFAIPGRHIAEVARAAVEAGQFPDVGPTEADRDRFVESVVQSHRTPGPAHMVKLADGRFVLAQEQRSEAGNMICVRTDATDLKRAESELRQQAERDPLTALANRYAFLRVLNDHLDSERAGRGRRGALILFDVDYFKQINDTLGHDVGDDLLIKVADRLRGQARTGDIAARLGGDEFAVVMPGLAEPQVVATRMDSIMAALARPMALAGRSLNVSFSAGVTVFPTDGMDAERLLKNADLALYEAKRTGRARWCRFRPEQAAAQDRHVRLSEALRAALASGAIEVAFQPKRLLRGGHAGFETFARWQSSDVWVPPGEFVPVAETSGQMAALGRAIVDAALARLRLLKSHGFQPGRVAINISAIQMLDQSFVPDTLAALDRHGLAPVDLEIEITETVLLGRAADRVEALLRELKALGITLALDDFGTGFASLAHLARLPIDRLKIDRSFVAEIGLGGRSEVIVRTVIGLARSLGMESLAEGVETPEQMAFLEAAGCDAAQGYLIARPVLSVDEVMAYLRAQEASDPEITGSFRPHRVSATATG